MAEWDEYLNRQEAVDGVRATWNVLPYSKADAQKLVVPPAIFFAPLKVSCFCRLIISETNAVKRSFAF